MKFEVCILAGGLSTRMGRDKSKLRLGHRTMLSIIRETAQQLHVPVRVIRRDLVPRCGPLGGVITALKTTHADAALFLACDMPLVSKALLSGIVRASRDGTVPVFASQRGRIGFPFLLPVATLAQVEEQVARHALSIHELVSAMNAHTVQVPARSRQLLNVNTKEEVISVQRLLARSRRKPDASLVTRGVRPYGSRHAKLADSSIARKRSCRQRQR